MSTVQFICFDLGRVLADFDWHDAVREMARFSGADERSIYDIVTSSPLALEYELGKIDSQTFFKSLKKTMSFQESADELRRLWDDIFTPIDHNIRIAGSLRRHHRLGLLSNTNESHVAHIRSQFRFLELFSSCVFSYETGSLKPDRDIYQKAEKRFQAAASEILFIDDMEVNVRGAQAAGWKAIHFEKGINLQQELESALGERILL
jgi:HAD superfamily hydrolase (TIGR01509 family)